MIFAAIMVKSVHTITDDSQNKSIEIDSSVTWGFLEAENYTMETFLKSTGQWEHCFAHIWKKPRQVET